MQVFGAAAPMEKLPSQMRGNCMRRSLLEQEPYPSEPKAVSLNFPSSRSSGLVERGGNNLILSIKYDGTPWRKGNYFRMRFHLQLFPPKFSGCAIVLLVLFLPAFLTAYVLHNLAWLVVVPLGIMVLAILVAALPLRRKVTPEQFADELERHLLGTEDPWGWDDTTSVAIADPRLEAVRLRLGPNLDSLSREQDKDELRAIIAALRRGELPETIVSPRRVSLFHLRR